MDMKLEDMNSTQLREYANELDRQERIKDIPTPKDDIDFEEVKNVAREHLESLACGHVSELECFHEELYDEVMEAIYGGDIFKWIIGHTERS
jgi:hypothetical protein